jgi:hypothetical protein
MRYPPGRIVETPLPSFFVPVLPFPCFGTPKRVAMAAGFSGQGGVRDTTRVGISVAIVDGAIAVNH